MATAVRHPAGHIVVKAESVVPGRLSQVFRRVPVLRGAASMWDILAIGMKSLAFSAENLDREPIAGRKSRRGG